MRAGPLCPYLVFRSILRAAANPAALSIVSCVVATSSWNRDSSHPRLDVVNRPESLAPRICDRWTQPRPRVGGERVAGLPAQARETGLEISGGTTLFLAFRRSNLAIDRRVTAGSRRRSHHRDDQVEGAVHAQGECAEITNFSRAPGWNDVA